jgi:hypothetical protein
MASTRQVLKVADKSGKYSVVYHEEDNMTPYWVFRHTWERNKDGYYTERKRISEKYTDLRSCFFHLAQVM